MPIAHCLIKILVIIAGPPPRCASHAVLHTLPVNVSLRIANAARAGHGSPTVYPHGPGVHVCECGVASVRADAGAGAGCAKAKLTAGKVVGTEAAMGEGRGRKHVQSR